MLIAMGSPGCGKSDPEQTRTPEKPPTRKLTAEEKSAMEAIAANGGSNKSVRPPGFFGGGSSHGRRPDASEDTGDQGKRENDPALGGGAVKKPSPNLVKPNAEAERKLRLARLYIANAASATSTVRREFLQDKAISLLKEVISKHPQDPAADTCGKLLAEIQADR
jgi:hypothetical protein